MKIEDTKSFQAMSKISQSILSKSTSKKQILSAVKIAENIGIEKWEKITDLPPFWKKIVIELVT